MKQEITVDPAFGERLGVVWKADLVDPLLDVLDGPIQAKKINTKTEFWASKGTEGRFLKEIPSI